MGCCIAVYHINGLPSAVLKFLTPYERLFKHKPDYKMLKCFGCACYPYLKDYNKHKFDYHSSKCIFIGYSQSHKGYKCLHASGRVYIARHVFFDELSFPYFLDSVFNSKESDSCSTQLFTPHQVYNLSTMYVSSLPSNNISNNSVLASSTSSSGSHSENLDLANNSSLSSQINTSYNESSNTTIHLTNAPILEPNTISSSQLQSSPYQFVSPTPFHTQQNTHPMTTRSKAGMFKAKLYTATLIHKESNYVYEALQNPKWFEAMKEEYNALIKNGTWSLVPRTTYHKVVVTSGCTR